MKDVKLKATPAVFKHVYNLFLMAQKGELVADEDSAVNTEGIKGLGEIGIIGVAAAVANAVFNATGTRVRDLPIRPEAMLD